VPGQQGDPIWKRSMQLQTSWSALLLAAVTVLALLDGILGLRGAAILGMPLLLAYCAAEWPRLMVNARVFIIASLVMAAILLSRPGGRAILETAASRMIYMPAFLAMLGLLRGAASASDILMRAGRHLINQPPSRRFIALAIGGHLFGVLFNIGGVALLMDMTKRANTLEAAGGDAGIVETRARRMTSAITRGFAAVVFWAPLGVAVNIILATISGLTWFDLAPIGLVLTIAAIAFGWLFDTMQRPPPAPRLQRGHEPRGAHAMAALVAHIVALAGLTALAEVVTRLNFNQALLIVVPAYAFAWALAIRAAAFDPDRVRGAMTILKERGIDRFGELANEVSVFAASTFLGVTLAAILPREALQAAILALKIPPGALAALVTLTITGLAFVGFNPMIAAAILGSVISSLAIPGLPPLALALALLSGWYVTTLASPFNSSLVMTAAILGRSPHQVGIGWNGRFAAAVLVVACVAFMLVLGR